MNINHFFTASNPWYKLKKGFYVIAAVISLLFVFHDLKAEKTRQEGWYVTGSAMRITNATGSGPRLDLGASVLVEGTSLYTGNFAGTVALGHQFTLVSEECIDRHLRLELELLSGTIRRKSVDIGALRTTLDDNVQLRALFCNGVIELCDNAHFRSWFGAGLGYGKTSFPDASYATQGCACLDAVTSDGLSVRMKLLVEKPVSTNVALFGEAGYMKLPGSPIEGLSSAYYDDQTLLSISFGIRSYF